MRFDERPSQDKVPAMIKKQSAPLSPRKFSNPINLDGFFSFKLNSDAKLKGRYGQPEPKSKIAKPSSNPTNQRDLGSGARAG